MGLLDCVSDKSRKYPVSPPPGESPIVRGTASDMAHRRSMGKKPLFASNTSIKGKDIDYWRHRLLNFLYKSEGREDVRELRLPLRQLGYKTIGDFIREIPPEIYQPYKNQINPDSGLRKDYKVIWERDGIAEPGMFKWEGSIDGQKCVGLQLDRKKSIPFGTHDGKGLFYCKPGHRALVPVEEVYPFKQFLRQFIGLPPRKDSMPLNLLPGRSSVRVAVAKQYKPGDRVHLPTENKWATILWTGRIGGDWVVDLVYDPEKPATGKMASPDEPCMSRSLSMAEFIDQVGKPSSSSTPPPNHVPPPPPPPKSPELDDEVFVQDNEIPVVINRHDGLRSSKDDSTESDMSDSENSVSEHSEEQDHSDENPIIESSSESETEEPFRRTFSEPTPEIKSKENNKQELKGLEVFEQQPLRSRPAHKPLFNLASFGRRKKDKPDKKIEKREKPLLIEKLPSPKRDLVSPKKESLFFSKSKSKSPKSPKVKQTDEPVLLQEIQRVSPKEIRQEDQPTTSETSDRKDPYSFFRRDRSRSPVHRKQDKKNRWSSDHREVPIDVPQELLTPKTPDTPKEPSIKEIKKQIISSDADYEPQRIASPDPKIIPSQKLPEILNEQQSSEEGSSSEDDEDSDEEKQGIPKNVQLQVSVELNQPTRVERDDSEFSSEEAYSPPYSPAIKDVGINLSNPSVKKDDQKLKISPLKTLGSFFTKKKTPPPKDYEYIERQSTPEPPVRKESLERKADDTEESLSSEDDLPPKVELPQTTNEEDEKPQTNKRKTSKGKKQGGFFSRKPRKSSIEILATPIDTQKLIQTMPIKATTPITSDQLGDQEGLFLDSLDVKDEKPLWDSEPSLETTIPSKRKGSKGKAFSFGFSKKSKQPSAVEETEEAPIAQWNKENYPNTDFSRMRSGSDTSSHEDTKDKKEAGKDVAKNPEAKPKKNSFKDSFTRTFSFTKDKKKGSFDKYESLGDFRTEQEKPNRPITLYVDNNEVIGAKSISKPKSKSTSVLVDIQPWNERRGLLSNIDIYNSPSDEIPAHDVKDSTSTPSPISPQPVPALLPKNADPTIPKHRIFTTPRSFFGFSPKSSSDETSLKAKKPSFKGSKLPKAVPATLEETTKSEDVVSSNFELPPLVRSQQPPHTPPISPRKLPSTPPPKVIHISPSIIVPHTPPANVPSPSKPPTSPRKVPSTPPPKVPSTPPPKVPSTPPPKVPSTPPPKLPSAPPPPIVVSSKGSLKDKLKTHLSGAEGRKLKSAMKQRKEIESIPKGIKIGDRVIWYDGRSPNPGTVMKLYKDGTDKYTAVVNFDRNIKDKPLSLVREGDAYIVTVEELLTPELLGIQLSPVTDPQDSPIDEVKQLDEAKTQTVRFEPSLSPEPNLPEINIELTTPGSPKEFNDGDQTVPPPFQEEEVDLACGLRRGIPSHDRSCCIETILFAMFYTNNTFDISVLYESGFEKEESTREIKALLRNKIVHPLRQSGFCEWSNVKKLKDAMQNLSPDFNTMSTDAEIMTFVLFERALKLGKFISYSTGVTDYLHQLVLDPRDLSKSSTLQQMFETSLEHMDNSKLRTIPTPALILEIPRANDKLVHYDAVIPNLSIMLSHLLENGPRLCICGMVAKYECQSCHKKSSETAIVFCENCKSMADQIHFKLDHEPSLYQITQSVVTMDLVAVICVKGGHYTSFVKCGTQQSSPWLFYDGAEIDNPKVSLEQNLGMWIDRLEKYPGKYQEAFAHPLLTHFLANSHICIYQSREKSSLV